MSNTIKLKRGSGSDPSASDLSIGEIAIRTDNGKLFTKKDNGSVAEISGSGGIDDGDKGDITVSNSGDTFTIDSGVVTSAKIADGTIVNADINSSAAIAGTKISPDFGSQNVTTTGNVNGSNLILSHTTPTIQLNDSNNNPDYVLQNNNGVFRIRDNSNSVDRIVVNTDGHVDVAGNLDIGNFTRSTNGYAVGSTTVISGSRELQNVTLSSSTVTATTQSAGNSTTRVATTAFVSTAIANLVDSAPSTLDTLNELAAALGDDANFSTTVTNSIATKLPLAGGTLTGNVIHNDNVKAIFGTSSDGLEVFHDGSHSFIKDSGTGALKIVGNDIRIENASNRNVFKAIGTACELYFDTGSATSKKFETTSAGGTLTGNLTVSGNIGVNGTVAGRDMAADGSKLDGIESGATADQTASEILTLIKTVDGSGSGLDADTLDGISSASFLRSDADDSFSGTITANSDTSNPVIKVQGAGPNFIQFASDSSGTVDADSINLIYRTSPNTLAFERASDATILFSVDADDGQALFQANLDVGGGLDVTGNISVSGTVDGRDVASDGSKLDGIESGATADQSASEILTLIKTVDGAGSGLDADTLDGISSASFVRSDANDGISGFLTITNDSGIKILSSTNGAGSKIQFSDHASGSYAQNGTLTYRHSDGAVTTTGGNSNDGWLFEGSETRTVVKVVGDIEATSNIYGAGSNITALNASNLGSGTVPQARLSASTLLTLIKTVDGSGSGLDADTLDGVSSASFVRSDASDTLTGATYTLNSSNAEKIILQGASNPYIRFQEGTTDKAYIQWHSDGYLQLANSEDGSRIRLRDDLRFTTDNFSSTNYKIWHEGNDGAGSGLDADTLDGISSASFVRSDADDTLNGQYIISDSADEKLQLAGSSNPYIRWQEGTTNKAYIQWLSSGIFQFVNQESGEYLRIASGNNGLTFTADGTQRTVWHSGNDGSGSGLDADLLDGVHGTSFLRSDTTDTASGAITFNGDVGFNGGAYAAHIEAGSDIAFLTGDWSGNHTKIQNHGNYLYIVGGSNGLVLRHTNGSNRWQMNSSGHFLPSADSSYDFGTSGNRVRNGYFDTLYGDGSNLTGISAGATGGGSDEVFYENGQTVTTNYTITNGKNAMCAGPITINSGVTVTVGSGENLTIV